MRLGRYSVFIISLILLSGCATQNTSKTGDFSANEQSSEPVEYVSGELNKESVFDLLTAEIAGQRRDFDLAHKLLEKQAALNNSELLAERATRIAQFLRDSDRVQSSAALWQSLAPDNEAPIQILINVLFHNNQVDQALDLIEPEDELTPELMSVVDSHLGRFSEPQAERLLNIIAARSPAKTRQLDLILMQAKVLRRLERTDLALEAIDSGLRIEPTQADLVVQKAEILSTEPNRSQSALALIERALVDNPTHRQLRALQIQQLLKIDPARVESTVTLAIEQADSDPQLVYYYALLLMENDQLDLSEQLFKDLIEADSEAADLNLYLGVISETRGDSEEAIEAFAKVQSGDSLLNATTRALGLMNPETELGRAQNFVDRSIQSDPDRAEDLQVLFVNWLNQNELTDQAFAYIGDLINDKPNNSRYLYARAMISDSVDTQGMLDDLERAYAIDPDSSTIQNALGYTLLEYSDQFERAFELIETAYSQTPDDAAVIDSMGWALHKLGRDDEALPYLERAYELFPDPEVGGHLIIVLSILGEDERANEIYQALIEENPDSDDLKEAKKWLNAL